MSQRVAMRRARTKEEVLAAAWRLAERDGLAQFTLRDLAAEIGMRAPSLYSYFDGKAAIYDAMFAQAYAQFDATMEAAEAESDIDPAMHPAEWLGAGLETYLEFCQASLPRYQLMFTRVIPGWEPSAEAYAVSLRSFERSRRWLALVGVTDDRSIDLHTAVAAGLAAQQIANDPGGRRWVDLAGWAARLLLTETRGTAPAQERT